MTIRTGMRMTAEEMLRLPNDGRRYELLDGELVELAPPGNRHNLVFTNVAAELRAFARTHDAGVVNSGDPGIFLNRKPDHVRAPDVYFLAKDRIPAGGIPDGYMDTIPDLIVEVVSPNDTATEVQQKIEEWLDAGARLVWAFYPNTRSVAAYQSKTVIRLYRENDTLDGGPVLPEFSCPVATFFE